MSTIDPDEGTAGPDTGNKFTGSISGGSSSYQAQSIVFLGLTPTVERVRELANEIVDVRAEQVRDLRESLADAKRQRRQVEEQLIKAQSVVPPLMQVIFWLERDLHRRQAQYEALNGKLDNVINERDELRAELSTLTRTLEETEDELDRAERSLAQARMEENSARYLAEKIRFKIGFFFPKGSTDGELNVDTGFSSLAPLPDLPTNVTQDSNTLAFCRQVLDQVEVVLATVDASITAITLDVHGVKQSDMGEPAPKTSDKAPDSAESRRLKREVRRLTRRVHELESERTEKQRGAGILERGPYPSTDRPPTASTTVLPGVAIFLGGILVREVQKIPSPSSGEHVVLVVLAALLIGLPALVLAVWARRAAKPTAYAVITLCAFSFVVGYLSWVVAMIAAAVALAVVNRTGHVRIGFGIAVLALLGVAFLFPHVMWWSWTGVDGISTLF